MKSRILRLTFGISLILGLTGVNAQDWPQWRGLNRDGKVTGFSAPQTWPQQLKQAWKVPVGLGDASPVLVNNTIYVYTLLNGNEVLQSIDAATGKQKWQSAGYQVTPVTGPASSHPGPRSTPAYYEGKIVAVGVAGDVACFDALTGKLLWRNEEYKGAVPQFFTGMSPLIADGVAFAHLGGPQQGNFVAFNLANGTVKWKIPGEGPAYGSPVIMTIDGSKNIVFQSLTKIVAFDPSNGNKLWEVATPAGAGRVNNSTTPVVDQQKLYFTGMNNGVNAVEIKKQGQNYVVNKLWTNAEFSTAYNTPVVKDGYLYGLSNQNKLFCINVSNGQTVWIDQAAHQNFGSIVDAGTVMVALSSTSNLVVYRPGGQAYSQLALIKVADTPVYAHPLLSGNRIYIKDNDSIIMYTAN